MDIFVDGMLDAVLDTFKTLPILFLAYLLVAFLSHDHSHKFSHFLSKDKKTSVLYASLLGCVPQCGFSSVMADLYSNRSVSLGTLVAVFIATSDEAIPLMVANPDSIVSLLELIGIKILLAIVWGYLIDLCVKAFSKLKSQKVKVIQVEEHEHSEEHHEVAEIHTHSHHTCGHIHTEKCDDKCVHSHGSCCGNNILAEAFDHTFEIAIYILVATFAFNLIIGYCGLDSLAGLLTDSVYVQILIASVIGLIPNCASSVFLVELFLGGALGFPALLAGLTTGAGVGLVILFSRNKKHPLENVGIVVLQYAIGILSGLIFSLFM